MAEFTNIKINDIKYDVRDANAARASALATKQDVISDLSAIRSGAALGATALQSYTETDPTVPAWAKASSKPSYTASEVGAVPTTRKVNNKALSSDITLTASDVGAMEKVILHFEYDEQNDKVYFTDFSGHELTHAEVRSICNSGAYIFLFDDNAGLMLIPRELSSDSWAFTYGGGLYNLSAYLSWNSLNSCITCGNYKEEYGVPSSRTINSKALTHDITLTASDIGALPNNTHIPADQVQSNWNETDTSSKAYIQNKPTFKTINGESIVGTGDIETGSGNVVTPVVNVASTGNVTQELQAGAFYKFGTVDSLTITLAPGNTPLDGTTPLLVYGGKFTISASSSASSLLALPASVTISPRSDSVAVGKTYEFNIADNGAIILEM